MLIRPPFLEFFKKAGPKCPPAYLFIHRLWIIDVVVNQKRLTAQILTLNRRQVFGKGDDGVDAPAVFDGWLIAQAARVLQLCAGAAEGAVAEAKVPLQLVRADDKFRPSPPLAAEGGYRAGIVAVHQVMPEHVGGRWQGVVPVPAEKVLYLADVVNGGPPFPETDS